jgi:hypothetical protein
LAAASFGFLPSIGGSISFCPVDFFDLFVAFAGPASLRLARNASIRLTTLPAAGRSFFAIGSPALFLLMRSISAVS